MSTGSKRERGGAGFESAEIQQALDEPAQPVGVADEHVVRLRRSIVGRHAILREHLGDVRQRRQRAAELVRHRRDEVRLQLRHASFARNRSRMKYHPAASTSATTRNDERQQASTRGRRTDRRRFRRELERPWQAGGGRGPDRNLRAPRGITKERAPSVSLRSNARPAGVAFERERTEVCRSGHDCDETIRIAAPRDKCRTMRRRDHSARRRDDAPVLPQPFNRFCAREGIAILGRGRAEPLSYLRGVVLVLRFRDSGHRPRMQVLLQRVRFAAKLGGPIRRLDTLARPARATSVAGMPSTLTFPDTFELHIRGEAPHRDRPACAAPSPAAQALPRVAQPRSRWRAFRTRRRAAKIARDVLQSLTGGEGLVAGPRATGSDSTEGCLLAPRSHHLMRSS